MSAELLRLHSEPRGVTLVPDGSSEGFQGVFERRERAAFVAGQRAGRAEAMANAVTTLDGATAQFAAAIERSSTTLISDSVELALTIAAELVRCEVSARRHGIEALVRETLMASGVGRGACTVHVSPSDAEVLSKLSFRSGTRIETDVDVQPACVQIETPEGLLVRDIESALASVAVRLREEARP